LNKKGFTVIVAGLKKAVDRNANNPLFKVTATGDQQ
jgi:hypothetical protein